MAIIVDMWLCVNHQQGILQIKDTLSLAKCPIADFEKNGDVKAQICCSQ